MKTLKIMMGNIVIKRKRQCIVLMRNEVEFMAIRFGPTNTYFSSIIKHYFSFGLFVCNLQNGAVFSGKQ